MKIMHLVVRDEHGNEAWRIPVEGKSDAFIHTLGLNISRTLAPGYVITAEVL